MVQHSWRRSSSYLCHKNVKPHKKQTFPWYFKFSWRRVWCSELSSRMYCHVKWLLTDVSEVRTASETSVDNHFTWQYIPEDNSEHHSHGIYNSVLYISYSHYWLCVLIYKKQWNANYVRRGHSLCKISESAEVCITNSPNRQYSKCSQQQRVSIKNTKNEGSGTALCLLAYADLEFQESQSKQKLTT
jgi:hypothetical protein